MNPNDNFSAALDSVAQMPSPEALEGLNTLSKLNPAEITVDQSARVGLPPGANTFVVVATHTPSGIKGEATGSNLPRVRNVALDRLAFAMARHEEQKAADAARPVPDRAKRARDLFVALHGHEPETPPVLDDVIAEACFELRKARQAAAGGLPSVALEFAKKIREAKSPDDLGAIDPEELELAAKAGPTGTEARVCADIAERQALGRSKYGTTVEENPLPLADWIRHAYEEALDLAIYLKRAGEELAKGQA